MGTPVSDIPLKRNDFRYRTKTILRQTFGELTRPLANLADQFYMSSAELDQDLDDVLDELTTAHAVPTDIHLRTAISNYTFYPQ